MLVAASDDDHEIFCLPLAPILASIEDTTSQRGNVTLANHDRGNMDSDGSMDVPSLISADAEENDDVVDSAVPRVGMAEVNEHQTSLASAHGSVHLHYGRNRHVSNRTSQRPKTNLQPIAAQQSAVVRSGDASIRSENQDHESIPIPDQKVSSRQELPQPGSDPHMGVMLINMADMTAHLPRSNAPLHIRDHSTTVGRASDIHYPQLGELEKASLGSNGRMSSSRSTNIRGSAVELEEPSRTRKGLDRLRSMLSRPKSSVSSTRSGHGSKPMYKEPRQFRRSLEASSTPVQQLDKGQVLTRSDTPEPEVHRGVGSPELVEKYVRQRLEAEGKHDGVIRSQADLDSGYSGPAVEAYSRTATEAAKMYADDPFNQTTLFAKDGQPIKYYYNGVQDVNYSIALPDRLAIEEVKSQDKEKAKNKGSVWGGKTPKPKSQKNDEVIDLDALLGDDLKDGLGDTVEFEDDAPIEIKHKKSRSRTKRQSRDGEFWKRRSSSSDSSRRDYTVSSVDGKEKPKKQIDTRNADGSGPRKEYTMHNAQGQPQLAALHNLPYREPDYFDATEILAARQPYDRTRESPYPYNPRPEHSRDLTYLHQYQEREMELLRRERDLAKNELDIARREAALAQQEAVAKLSFPARSATQNPTVESID